MISDKYYIGVFSLLWGFAFDVSYLKSVNTDDQKLSIGVDSVLYESFYEILNEKDD